MPVGELPSRSGFIVLGVDELRKLLGTTEMVMPGPSRDGRLSAFLIQQPALASGTFKLSEALEALRKRTVREIGALRQGNRSDRKTGVRHARLAMQAVNIQLAMEAMV